VIQEFKELRSADEEMDEDMFQDFDIKNLISKIE
jgi:hypothetical protein